MKASGDLETFISVRTGQRVSLWSICGERAVELKDGAEEFIQNTIHKDRVIENVEEVLKCEGNT